MSNRRCNYCLFQDIKKFAEQTGQVVTTIPDTEDSYFWPLGVSVYVHPPGVVIADLPQPANDEPKEFWVCWFMELPDHCVC